MANDNANGDRARHMAYGNLILLGSLLLAAATIIFFAGSSYQRIGDIDGKLNDAMGEIHKMAEGQQGIAVSIARLEGQMRQQHAEDAPPRPFRFPYNETTR